MRGRRMGPGVGRPLLRTAATTAVIAGTASAVSGRVHHRQDEKYAAQDQEQYEQQMYQQQVAAQQATQASAPAQPAYMAEINNLDHLRAQGVITEEEFQAKKKQILGI